MKKLLLILTTLFILYVNISVAQCLQLGTVNGAFIQLTNTTGGCPAMNASVGTIINITNNNNPSETAVYEVSGIFTNGVLCQITATRQSGVVFSVTNFTVTYNSLTCTYTGGNLPISLLSFTGKPINNAIALKWETASEQDNAYIAIERSKDGINFVELDQKKGYGTSAEPKQYDWTDYNPLYGINYYRLRQVDYDGKFEYHPIIAVEFDGKVAQPSIRLYPTEAKDRITIQVDTPPTEDATLLVVDLTGRILQRQQMAAGIVQHELPLNNLPAGQYFVTIQSDKTVQTARFIKL